MRTARELAVQTSGTWVRLAAFSLLVLLPLVVSPWGADGYGQPKALLLLTLSGLMVFGWLASVAAGGGPRWTVTRAELPLWVFVLMVLLSTWATVDARATFVGVFGRHEGLPAVLAYVLLYFVGVHFFGSRDGFGRLARVLGVASLLVMAYGFTRLWLPPFFPGEARLQDAYSPAGPRVFSLVGGPILYGAYLNLVAPLVTALYLTARRPAAAAVWVGAGLVALGSALLTLSRAAWLGLVLGSGAFLGGLRAAGVRAYRRRILFMAAVVVAAAAVLLGTVARPAWLYERAKGAFEVQAGSTAQHVYIWKQTVRLIAQRPLLGWGLETLGQVFPYRREELVPLFDRPPIIDRAHNDLLHVAVSIGIPGALAFAVFWILTILSAVRLVRRTDGDARVLAAGWLGGLIGYLVQAQFSFSSVAVTPLVWLLAGAACGWEFTHDSG